MGHRSPCAIERASSSDGGVPMQANKSSFMSHGRGANVVKEPGPRGSHTRWCAKVNSARAKSAA